MKKSTDLSTSVDRAGRIVSPAAIAALAAPVRQELVDTVEALGGAATIAELAAELGRPADGLYYHVRRLVKAGLLVREPDPIADRYRTPVAPGVSLALAYRPDQPKNAAAVRRAVAAMLRIARRDFDRGLATPGVAVHGPRRALWAGRATGWLSGAERAELVALLARLSALIHGARRRTAGEARVSLCFVLAPAIGSPRRGTSGSPARNGIASRSVSEQPRRSRGSRRGRGSSGGARPRRTS